MVVFKRKDSAFEFELLKKNKHVKELFLDVLFSLCGTSEVSICKITFLDF